MNGVRPQQSDGTDPRKDPWSLPYIDQPLSFWDELKDRYGEFIHEIYFPPSEYLVGTGRPILPDRYLNDFLRYVDLPKAVLLNAAILSHPIESIAGTVIENLRRWRDEFGIFSATIANLRLAEFIRNALPEISLTASVLMDITRPNQVLALNGVIDVLVPGSGAVRSIRTLKTLQKAFNGRLRLMVNEACLAGCCYRSQHFHEMALSRGEPQSLCKNLLDHQPWMRLTGAWIVPQFLKFYEGVYDELKLAGRGTLGESGKYLKVVDAYINRRDMLPCDIGGGPASVMEPIEVSEELFAYILQCDHQCHVCNRCKEYYGRAVSEISSTIGPDKRGNF